MSSGNDLYLGRDEILLLDAVLLEEDLQNACLEYLVCLLVIRTWNSAYDDVQVFCRDKVRCFLCHLLVSEMRKKISDIEYGIRFLLTYYYLVSFAVVGEYNAVNSQRYSGPLILLDTAVVMRLEINGIVILINRIGLEIEPRRIDVGTKDVESFSRSLLSDYGSGKALALDALIDFVSGLERILGCNINIPQLFSSGNGISSEFALSL